MPQHLVVNGEITLDLVLGDDFTVTGTWQIDIDTSPQDEVWVSKSDFRKAAEALSISRSSAAQIHKRLILPWTSWSEDEDSSSRSFFLTHVQRRGNTIGLKSLQRAMQLPMFEPCFEDLREMGPGRLVQLQKLVEHLSQSSTG